MNELLQERYKHILGQMSKIDDRSHKCLMFFQQVATVLISGVVMLWISRDKLGVAAGVARQGVVAAMILMGAVAVMTIAVIVAGAFSWMDYRYEETLLTARCEEFQRPAGRWLNFWRWQETYIVGLVFVITVISVFLMFGWVLPDLK